MSTPLVIVRESISAPALDWLRERCRVLECGGESDERRSGVLGEASGLIVRTYTQVDSALLDRAPNLRCVARAGVGLDNIDLDACRARGVRVVHTPDANTGAVAELVLAFLLDALRPRPRVTGAMGLHAWQELRAGAVADRELAGLRLGILGMGRVGSGVARVASALGMHVCFSDIRFIPHDRRHGAREVALNDLLEHSEALSIHVDARSTNRHLVNDAFLARCRDNVLMINTSRGMVIDAHSLARFLRTHPRARAMLDVHEPEPVHADSPLLHLPNAILTPHIGAATRNAHERMSWVVRDLWRVLNGEQPEHEAGCT